jgi:hypothetical protein
VLPVPHHLRAARRQASVDLVLQAVPVRREKTVAMCFSFLRWKRSFVDTLGKGKGSAGLFYINGDYQVGWLLVGCSGTVHC